MKKELVIVALMLVLLAGCNSQATPPSETSNNDMQMQQIKHQSAAENGENDVRYLEDLAKGIEGVNNAHVVVIGKTAIVGIDVDSKLERSRVGTIKYSVSEAFSKDPHGIHAIVTADIDLRERIAEIGGDISAGRPVQGMIEELSDIVGRIVPQIPADLMPAAKENEIKTNSQDNKGKYNSPEQMINEHEQKIKNK
jgi:YhcN/YlaJ family sporulation lipoprotein